ncbi:hypothetical protein diail_5423 [Diaporthe ilicicola]|nr:hypothetical protein diail_5423 [Diaporthe ilicicola]
MSPRKVKHDPEVEGIGSPDQSAIQSRSGRSSAPSNDNNGSMNHDDHTNPYINPQIPGLGAAGQGTNLHQLLFTGPTGSFSIPGAPLDAVFFAPLYMNGNTPTNNMSFHNMPSSSNSGNGGNASRRQTRQNTGATSQGGSRAARGEGVNPGQGANQYHGFTTDLTNMDPSLMGLVDSTLTHPMDPSLSMLGGYNPPTGVYGSTQQQQGPQRMDYTSGSPVTKFDPDTPVNTDFAALDQTEQYDDFMQDDADYETKSNPSRSRKGKETATTAPRGNRRGTGPTQASTAANNATTANSPANGTIEGQGQGGRQAGAASHRRKPAPHVPPNRIAEAGPVQHADPNWRPYGVNHWHVFLYEPTLLKYLSSTEIKDIRDHCYELAQKGGIFDGEGEDGDDIDGDDGGSNRGNDDGNDTAAAALRTITVPGSSERYSPADASAVWRHCDAYIRRRGQVRNNEAARRSRQRKEAECKYWKALALAYGAPDHDFDMDESKGSRSAAAAAAAASPEQGSGGGRARNRSRGQGRGQGGQAQAGPSSGGSGGRQEDAAAAAQGGPSADAAASAPEPDPEFDFDFNQPMNFDGDFKNNGTGFDPFADGY